MNKETWDFWLHQIDWILTIAKKRNWDVSEKEIKPTISATKIVDLEQKLGISYPSGFKTILTEYGGGIHFYWNVEDDEPEGEFAEIFCGGGDGFLWDFEHLESTYLSYKNWVSTCFPDENDDYDKVWHHKIGFLNVPNGDIIAFDTDEKVVYLSHDGSDFHGQILGDNFIDFVTKWAKLGFVGLEDSNFEPFYDYQTKTLLNDSSILEKWVKWLG